MAESLGTIRGQMILDVKQALAAYTQARQANISTVTALHTGAGALTMAGAAIAGVGTVMAAGLLTAVDAAAQFEKQLSFFGAVTDTNEKDLEAVRQKALQLGTDTVFSASQIADSFVELGKSGISAREIIDGIGEGVAALGAAADIPLDTAANIITAAVATFGLAATDAVHVADQLAGAANASIIDVTDLGTSLKYVGGVAASLGIPFDDVNTALGILGEKGIKGSTAGTSLRQILLGLGGATPKATAALKDLGIITEDGGNKFFTAEGKAKSLSEVFQILQDATAGYSDKQKLATFQSIFATRALPSLIALTGEGAEGFAEMAKAIGETTAAEVSGKRLNNLAGDIEILKGNIDTLLISGGSGFQEFARGIVQGVTSIVQAFIDLPAGAQTTILAVLGIVGALLVIVGTIGLFAGAILQIIALVTVMGPIWTGLLSVFKAVQAAIWAINAALLANPIILIIALVVALIAALIWFFTSTDLGREVWANFMSFLSEAWTNIVNVATTVWTALVSFFTDLWNNLSSFFATWGPTILAVIAPFIGLPLLIAQNWDAIAAFFTTLWTNIVNGVTGFVNTVVNFFIQLPAQIGAFFAALPGMIGFALGFLLGTVVRIFLTISTWLITNVPIMINNVVAFFMALPGQVIQFFIDLYNGVVNWVMQMQITVALWILNLINNAIAFFSALPGQIVQFFADLYAGVVAWVQNMQTTVANLILTMINNAIQFFQQLPANVARIFQQVVAFISQYLQDAYNRVASIASSIISTFQSIVGGLPGLVSGIFNRVVDAIKGVIGSAIKAVTSFASGIWEGFKAGLGIHSPSYIEHAMWAITDVLDEETQRMRKQVRTMQGLGNGISEIGNNLSFGQSLDADLLKMQQQLAAAKNMQSSMALSTSVGVDDATAAQLAVLNEKLAEIAEKDTVNIEKYEVNNPEPETASDSLPESIRKATLLVG